MEEIHSRLVMNSGKEYIIDKHPEDVVARFTNQVGVVINGFISYDGIIINPSHVSSIEEVKPKAKAKIQDKPAFL